MRQAALRRRLMVAALAVGAGRAARAQAPGRIGAALAVPGPGSSISLPPELAARLGLDARAGLALRLRFVGGGGLAIRELTTGNADHMVIGLPAAMRANLLKGAGLVLLAAIDDLPLYTLVVRQDLKGVIRTIADLRGRVIGVHSDSLANTTTSHQLIELLLRQHGVPLSTVRFVTAGQTWASQSAALLSRSVDASMCDEPYATRLEAAGLATTLYATGNPADAAATPGAGFLRACLFAGRAALAADPERSARLVRMLRDVLGWLQRHGAAAAADALGLQGDERDAIVAVARRYPRQYSVDGSLSQAQLDETERFFRASNPELPGVERFRIADMVDDRWVARRP